MLTPKQIPPGWNYTASKGYFEKPIHNTRYMTIEPLLSDDYLIAIYDQNHMLKIEKIRVKGFAQSLQKANSIFKKYTKYYRKNPEQSV